MTDCCECTFGFHTIPGISSTIFHEVNLVLHKGCHLQCSGLNDSYSRTGYFLEYLERLRTLIVKLVDIDFYGAAWCSGNSIHVFGRCLFESMSWHQLTGFFFLCLALPDSCRFGALIKPRPVPSKSFTLHHSPVNLPFDAVQSKTLTLS